VYPNLAYFYRTITEDAGDGQWTIVCESLNSLASEDTIWRHFLLVEARFC
jgi:hypothetical protein